MADKKKAPAKFKMTMKEFERSAVDKKADKVELAKINKKRSAKP